MENNPVIGCTSTSFSQAYNEACLKLDAEKHPPLPTSAMNYATLTLSSLREARDNLANTTKKLYEDDEKDLIVLTGLEATKANLACTIQQMEAVLHRLICAGGTQP